MCAREALIDAFPVVEPGSEQATKKEDINETKQARSCRRKRKQNQQ